MKKSSNWIDVFVNGSINFLHKTTGLIFVIMQTIMVNVIPPFVLVLVGSVEIPRMYHGLQHIEAESVIAMSASWALFAGYVLLRFIIAEEVKKEGKPEETYRPFTLFGFLYSIFTKYIWTNEVKEKSKVKQYESFVNYLTVFIIVISTFGTLYETILLYSDTGSWIETLPKVLFESNLEVLFTVILGSGLGVFLIIIQKMIVDFIILKSNFQITELTSSVEESERLKKLSGFMNFTDFTFANKRLKLDEVEDILADKWIKYDKKSLTVMSDDLETVRVYPFKAQERSRSLEKIKLDWTKDAI